MTNTIESEKILIKDLFKKWFRIPEYQRPYVWGRDQVIDLLDDITFAQQQNKDSEYFLGSIVFQKKEIQTENGEYIENDLLDGQQRLTTLLLLKAVIRDLSTKETRIQTCQESIFQQANPDDNIPERLRIVFDIRDEVKEFIDKYVKEKKGTDKIDEIKNLAKNSNVLSISNMASAILEIRYYFNNNEAILNDFFPYLRNKVLMISVASEALEDAFRLFTIMNDRGLKLRNSDILKAENLRIIKNVTDIKKYAKEWEEVENYFEDDFDVFLSHLRTILVKEKARSNLLEEFENNIYNPKAFDKQKKIYKSISPKLEKGKETFKFITKYKNNYVELFDNDHYSQNNSNDLDNLITVMNATLPADLWIPPVLNYYEKFKFVDFFKFLQRLDNKFSYDWIIQKTPTMRIENVNTIIKQIEKSSTTHDLFSSDVFKIESQKLFEILDGEIYGKRFARYILYKLDYLYSGSEEKFIPSKTISVEHILPRNPKSNSQWTSDFSEDDRNTWTNRIGNLVLISRRKNASQGRLDYIDKKKKYFEKNIELFRNSVRILSSYSSWTPTQLNENQNNVIKKLKDHYNINHNQST